MSQKDKSCSMQFTPSTLLSLAKRQINVCYTLFVLYKIILLKPFDDYTDKGFDVIKILKFH